MSGAPSRIASGAGAGDSTVFDQAADSFLGTAASLLSVFSEDVVRTAVRLAPQPCNHTRRVRSLFAPHTADRVMDSLVAILAG